MLQAAADQHKDETTEVRSARAIESGGSYGNKCRRRQIVFGCFPSNDRFEELMAFRPNDGNDTVNRVHDVHGQYHRSSDRNTVAKRWPQGMVPGGGTLLWSGECSVKCSIAQARCDWADNIPKIVTQ